MEDRHNAIKSTSSHYSRKDEGHFEWHPGMTLGSHYQVTRCLGDGTFGRVLEARDKRDDRLKAIKVIRAVSRYIDSAKVEAEIIQRLQRTDPEGTSKVVRLYDSFDHGPNYCIVFELLGRSLYDVIKLNLNHGMAKTGFSVSEIKVIARQCFEALHFMHKQRLTHTDLKPENILFVSSSMEYDCRTVGPRQAAHRPRHLDVKVIDFGGATFHNEHHSDIINTRQYRAPEVILGELYSGLSWSESSDLWSLGCLLVELYSGKLLFPTHDNYEHLAMIERTLEHIPAHMARSCQRSMRKFFDSHYSFNWPKLTNSTRSERAVRDLKYLEVSARQDIIPSKYRSFRELVLACLKVNPVRRIRPQDALLHDFFIEP
jgi:dual-specificity kinase